MKWSALRAVCTYHPSIVIMSIDLRIGPVIGPDGDGIFDKVYVAYDFHAFLENVHLIILNRRILRYTVLNQIDGS